MRRSTVRSGESSNDANATALRAGGIVLAERAGRLLTAVVHRPRHDDWSFPKGKVDPGESLRRTAVREVWEETGLHCRLGDYLGLVSGGLTDGSPKPTHYWLMDVLHEDTFVAGSEIDALRWVDLTAALGLLTHPRDRELARQLSRRVGRDRSGRPRPPHRRRRGRRRRSRRP
ncbi:NUDIX hydrolase [Aeromicrobium phragmitis]|uniref:NUDIX hydrolase n=1 Tax=Aeromicrobium phragmitis TaxID=2478914 RepID=UPI00312C816E